MTISSQLPALPDYSLNVQSPIEAFGGGYKIGAMMLQARQQQALQQQEIDRQTQLKALMGKPNATTEDYSQLAMLMPPDQARALKESYAMQTEAQQSENLKYGGQVLAAFSAGQPTIGIQLLRDRATAERNSGRGDQANAFETWAKLAEINPTLAQNTIGTMLATMPGGDKTITSAIEMSGDARTAQADAKFREIMAGATTVDDVFARIPQLAQLGEKGVGHAERLLTQQRLLEQQRETAAAGKAKRGETQIESLKVTNILNTLIAGTTKESPAFTVDKDGEVTENESFWAKYAFVPTAGGPDMAVPGAIQQRPAAPVFDTAKAAALGLDQSTLELVKAQIELDPKSGAKLLYQIINSNIKAKLKGFDHAKLSSYGQQLVDEGLQPGTPDFNRRMAEFNRAKLSGTAKGDGVFITNVMGEKASETLGKGFGTFAQSAMEKAQNAEDAASDVSMIVDGMRGMGGGPVAQFKAWAGQFAPAGTEWSNINSMAELASTIQAKLAPTMREAGSGATSDMEMKSFMRAIPTISTSERGRELMAKYARRIADRAQTRAEIVNNIEASRKLPTPADIRAGMKSRLGDSFFDAADRAYFGMKPTAATGAHPETATVGGKTYARPVGFSDAQWLAYKQAVGAK